MDTLLLLGERGAVTGRDLISLDSLTLDMLRDEGVVGSLKDSCLTLFIELRSFTAVMGRVTLEDPVEVERVLEPWFPVHKTDSSFTHEFSILSVILF